jgi:glycosyltransferase involved in cell wall biosynthesis
MKIIGLAQKESGCGYHRIQLPLVHMESGERIVCDIPTAEILERGWDVLTFNRICLFDEIWPNVKEATGVKVVMDMDDYWELPPSHPLYITYKTLSKRIITNIEHADLVTVTTEALAEKVRPYNANVIILPNAIPYGLEQFTADRVESDMVRVFWAGGSTHERDLEIVRGPIKRLIQYPNVRMVLGGYTESMTWRRMFSSFTSGGELPYMKIEGLPPSEYMSMYEHADIMLVPLEESRWHSCKSNLKLLEAAAKKIPVICSRVPPYSVDEDAPVLWVEKQSDWYKQMKYLINDKEARENYGQRLFEWANRKYNFAAINRQRQSAFADLIGA